MGETHALEGNGPPARDDGNGHGDSGRGSAVAPVRAGVGSVTATGESSALISLIERAARDPSVDIDKMERLFQMHAAVEQRHAKAAYLRALADMQPELPVVNKRGEISRKARDDSGEKKAAKPTKYAKWEDVVEAISPILAKHGFSISFRIKQDARVEVTAVLGHRDGHSEQTSMQLGIDDSGAKNNIQGWGSSVSYGKRYTAFALLNIVARGEDDDGKAAGDPPAMDKTNSLAALNALVQQTKADVAWLCGHYSVETLDDLTAKQIADATAGLMARKRKQESGK